MTTLKIKPDFMDISEINEIISYLNNVLERKISEKKIKDEESKKRLPIPRRNKPVLSGNKEPLGTGETDVLIVNLIE